MYEYSRDHVETLLLSWSMPPTLSGSAVVVGNLISAFDEQEMLLAGESNKTIKNLSHSSRQSVRVQFGWPFSIRGARWWRMIQFPFMVFNVCHLARKRKVKNIIAVFPSTEFLFAGFIASVFSGARLFPYFHNTYYENRTGLFKAIASVVQSYVFKRATQVFLISDGMAKLFSANYPGLKHSVIRHSHGKDQPQFIPVPEIGDEIRFTLIGNINDSCEDAVLRLLRTLRRVPGAVICLYSGTSRKYLRSIGIMSLCDVVSTVTDEELTSKISDSDILLLPLGLTGGLSDVEYETIFPTRTIEYLLSNRPILAHCPQSTYLSTFLREHNCALVIDESNEEKILEAVGELRSNSILRQELVANALQASKIFHIDLVASEVRKQLSRD